MYQRAILEKDVEKDHDLLVVHRYISYRPDDRHYGYGEGEGEGEYGWGEGEYSEDDYGEHYEGNEDEQDDQQIDVFFTHTWYTCQIILVNTSPIEKQTRLFTQIPQGAIPAK